MTLDRLLLHQKGIIKSINLDRIPIKLIEMGFLPGVIVEVMQVAPFKDPICLRVNDAQISIRKDLAQEITIALIENAQ